MRVAPHARVSTERQERQGTIASQLDALHRFAQEQHHEVVSASVCVDDGYSGSRLDRPGLDRLRNGAEAGAFEAVLVLCPDRLARKWLSIRQIALRLTESAHPSATGLARWGHRGGPAARRAGRGAGRPPSGSRSASRPSSARTCSGVRTRSIPTTAALARGISSQGTTCYVDWSAAGCVTWRRRAIACGGATEPFITTTMHGTRPPSRPMRDRALLAAPPAG